LRSVGCWGWNKNGGLTVLHDDLKLFQENEQANQSNSLGLTAMVWMMTGFINHEVMMPREIT